MTNLHKPREIDCHPWSLSSKLISIRKVKVNHTINTF